MNRLSIAFVMIFALSSWTPAATGETATTQNWNGRYQGILFLDDGDCEYDAVKMSVLVSGNRVIGGREPGTVAENGNVEFVLAGEDSTSYRFIGKIVGGQMKGYVETEPFASECRLGFRLKRK